jgi:hypothetical protein
MITQKRILLEGHHSKALDTVAGISIDVALPRFYLSLINVVVIYKLSYQR